MVDPRVERSKTQVLEAARALLKEVGFRGVTIEALSARSGVAKTTIYRHWNNAAEIIVQSFTAVMHRAVRVDSGSLRGDLLTLLSGMASTMHDRDWIAAATSMMEAAMYDQDLKVLQEEFIRQSKAPMREAIQLGIDRGEIAENTDIDFLIAQLCGPFFYQCLVLQQPMSAEKVSVVVDSSLAS